MSYSQLIDPVFTSYNRIFRNFSFNYMVTHALLFTPHYLVFEKAGVIYFSLLMFHLRS